VALTVATAGIAMWLLAFERNWVMSGIAVILLARTTTGTI
jgi:hypothetical protein